MKTLILVRHAKSDWGSGSTTDFDRPLNARGKKDAPFMGELIRDKKFKPELILSSPANRAKTTAIEIAKILFYPENKIEFVDRIYNGGNRDILKIINAIDNSINNAMLFGHNPDITSLVTLLSDGFVDNMPTCGVACIDFNIENWNEISDNRSGNLRFFEYPKLY
jgi:phosphohistidine phosphatase